MTLKDWADNFSQYVGNLRPIYVL